MKQHRKWPHGVWIHRNQTVINRWLSPPRLDRSSTRIAINPNETARVALRLEFNRRQSTVIANDRQARSGRVHSKTANTVCPIEMFFSFVVAFEQNVWCTRVNNVNGIQLHPTPLNGASSSIQMAKAVAGGSGQSDDGDTDLCTEIADARSHTYSRTRTASDNKIRETWDTINLYFI